MSIQTMHQALIDSLTIPGTASSNPALLTPDLADIIDVWPAYQASQVSGQIIDIPGMLRQSLIGTMAYTVQDVDNGFFRNYFFSDVSGGWAEFYFLPILQPVDLKNFTYALLSAAMLLQQPSESACLDGVQLRDALAFYNAQLGPFLAQLYINIYATWGQLQDLTKDIPDAVDTLKAAILNGQFTVQINNGINGGDEDSVLECEWFLFNLWVLLSVLGDPNVDDSITSFKNAGLEIPDSVGPVNWSSTYTQWFNPLDGVDMVPMVAPQLNRDLHDSMLSIPVYCYVLTGMPYFQLKECRYYVEKHDPPN